MAQPLPRLRMNLDFMPSPVEDRPGLLIRDSYGYSDAILIIPPELVQCLSCFDGEQSSLDLRELLVRMTGELDVGNLEDHLLSTLSSAGFLHDETYERMREQRRLEFSAAESRVANHAGSAYPEDPAAVRQTLNQYLDGIEPPPKPANLLGIAAPHVSPFGGWQTYRSAYTALSNEHRDRTFVILGTSHYGDPERFGLTRKPFDTPYGRAVTDTRLVDELSTQSAATMEDYCHSVEHSVEFQVLFLQHLYGPQIRILPILCGSFARSILSGMPEDNEPVRRFLGSLGEIAAREGDKLTWVLGIDMAHMGARYGDDLVAIAGQNEMQDVASRDKERIDRVLASDAKGFWDLIQENQDDLKWCGSSPLYTFLRAVPDAKGSLRAYDQWNIDERSVVSFGALTFER